MIIASDPQNGAYKNLIDLAFDVCDEFILIVRRDPGLILNDNGRLVLKKLNSSLKEIKEQSEWTGTELNGQTASVYYYNTDNEARDTIKEASNSLYCWVQPDLPEDLSFIKNGKPWLTNTAHERESHIYTEDKGEIDKILNIKGLEVRP